MKKLILIISLLLIFTAQAWSADIYVKLDNQGGKGTKDNPYSTLWKALAKALRGDVIHTTQGTYNGKGGSGSFLVKVPNLTVVGGYNDDFSVRNPFKYLTILERAKDYKGDATGLQEGIIAGKSRTDHSGMIIDGFVLNGENRNKYSGGSLSNQGSFSGPLFQASYANVKMRNCILLNPHGVGIYCTWQGSDNEVSNCFILNTEYTGISTRSNQGDAIVNIKNNTIAFVWDQPHKGGGTSVFIGSQGITKLENNIFMFNQAFAVINGFGNEDTEMKGNIFYQCQGGYYKYMDDDGANLIVWENDELEDLNEEDMAEDYMLLETGDNTTDDPKCKPDKDYFEKFSNYVSGSPGKLVMDEMNEWRRSVGLPLQAKAGTGPKNYAMPYPVKAVVPNLISKLPNKGVQSNGPFEKYQSLDSSTPAKDYKEISINDFSRESDECKNFNNTPVMFQAGLGSNKIIYELADAPRSTYRCVMLLPPGVNEPTRDYTLGYILKGTEAEKKWDKYYKKKTKNNAAGGIWIRGNATYFNKASYPYPVGVIIDKVSKKK